MLWTGSGDWPPALQGSKRAADVDRMMPGGISPANLFVAILAATFLVMPVATLAHELAHAVVALRVSSGPVVVHVGRPPAWLRFEGARLQVSWSPLPMRGVRFAGLCIYRERSAGPGGRLAVAVAGPLVTALLIPVFLFAMVKCLGMPDWVPGTWGVSALVAFVSVLVNADPRPACADEKAGRRVIFRDGPRALAAYRAWRGLHHGHL